MKKARVALYGIPSGNRAIEYPDGLDQQMGNHFSGRHLVKQYR
jgi:hypothetical protein